jgi:hypothetical protein
MRDVLRGIFFSAIIVYSWGLVFWWSALPYRAMRHSYDSSEVSRYLESRFPDSGTYVIPDYDVYPPPEASDRDVAITVIVLAKEDLPSNAGILAAGFIHALVMSALIAYLLCLVRPALGSYRSRVLFVAVAGVTTAISCDLIDPIWWYRPWSWNVVKSIYDCLTWVAAGLVLALFIKRAPQVAEKPQVAPDTDSRRSEELSFSLSLSAATKSPLAKDDEAV